ncbi:siderophore-interacting protein [Streptomyces sp. AgN23]|uniref:siderophore-interacting protein n=1 Tax=Streptomyces sp. AgN23 TaxID=1188315 RepID=UPI001B324F6B|nr:siderophore-interacting protein [Streptomyces sp. AgN23]AJZ82045.2 siderophore-interacting protein [Streptomyces sp. AgN23]
MRSAFSTKEEKNMKSRLVDRLLLPVHVDTVEQLGPRLRRVILTGSALAGLTWHPGQHVRLQVAPAPPALDWIVGTLRTYSIWDFDDQAMELIVFDHGEGPGAGWARTARPGDELMLLKPQGNLAVQSEARYHLFAGDETAQVSYGPMLRALPDDAQVFARVEVDSPAERIDLTPKQRPAARPGWNVDWTYRQGRSAASSRSLVEAVRSLPLPDEPGIAYLAGEARTIQLIRRHLVEERNWPRRHVRTKPFWTPGRKGLD